MTSRHDAKAIAIALVAAGLTVFATTGAAAGVNHPAAPVHAAPSAASSAAAPAAAPAPAPEAPAPVVSAAPRPKPAAAPVAPAAPRIRTINVAALADANTMQDELNACIGAIQINFPGYTPEIAQHNYCGGAWFNTVTTGEQIRIVGGTMAGTYVVNGNRRTVQHDAGADALNGLGDLVLQTCVGDVMVVVGLSRV